MRHAVTLVVLTVAGCAAPEPKPLVFLYRDACIEETKVMLYRLDAALAVINKRNVYTHQPIVYTKVHLDTLTARDVRKGYLTPTVLRDGIDLFGLGASTQLSSACRFSSPDEVPSADAIQARLLAP